MFIGIGISIHGALSAGESLPPDETAPILSDPSASETGATTAIASVTTDEGNGDLYVVITQSATPPTAQQVYDGEDHEGNPADFAGSTEVTGVGVIGPVGIVGLDPETTYYAHFMHEDAAGNRSEVVSSASFETDAASTGAGEWATNWFWR